MNQRPGASDAVASRCVLSSSLAKDLTKHVAAWLQITVDCQEQPHASVLPSCCELQSCHSTCKESYPFLLSPSLGAADSKQPLQTKEWE